jgi:cobalt-zinc-cadmium efflux system protein
MHRDTKKTEGRFVIAMALTAIILIVEVAGGLLTHSLALLSDAAHVLLDMLALGMSYVALRLAARPADDRHTYGYHRFEVLAALVNGSLLFVMAVGIFREAWRRFQAPEAVLAAPMLVVAVIGLGVNLVVMRVLGDHDHDDLNVRSAWLHVLGDMLSSVGVIAAGLVILLTGWTLADPLVSVLIGCVILVGAGRVLHQALHILLEGTPEGLHPGTVARAMRDVPGVAEVHDLHIWTVSPGYVALSAHAVLDGQSFTAADDVLANLRQMLAGRFAIQHTTIQVECADCGQGVLTCANGH